MILSFWFRSFNRIIDPSKSFAVVPYSANSLIIYYYVSLPMLFLILYLYIKYPIFPHTHVKLSIWPFKYSISFFFIIYILSIIDFSIAPSEYPSSMHLIILPLAFVFSVILPRVYPHPLYQVVLKISIVF